MIVRKGRRKLFRLDGFTISVGALCVFVSFCLVSICNGTQGYYYAGEARNDSLLHAVTRVADAFEMYNDKRFDM